MLIFHFFKTLVTKRHLIESPNSQTMFLNDLKIENQNREKHIEKMREKEKEK